MSGPVLREELESTHVIASKLLQQRALPTPWLLFTGQLLLVCPKSDSSGKNTPFCHPSWAAWCRAMLEGVGAGSCFLSLSVVSTGIRAAAVSVVSQILASKLYRGTWDFVKLAKWFTEKDNPKYELHWIYQIVLPWLFYFQVKYHTVWIWC